MCVSVSNPYRNILSENFASPACGNTIVSNPYRNILSGDSPGATTLCICGFPILTGIS